MIVRDLAWRSDPRDCRLRIPSFTERVPFDLGLATSIACAVEARVAELLDTPIPVDVFPPSRMEEQVWMRICDGGLAYELSAACGALTFVVSRQDALKIAACAFGEITVTHSERMLSSIEVRVFERFIAELTSGLSGVLGPCSGPAVRASSPAPRHAYCEFRFGEPLDVVLGVALLEKRPHVGPMISAEMLAECPLECSVRFRVAAFDIFTIADLTPGDVVPLPTKVGPYATLNVGRDPIAAGEGGVLGDHTAFKVHELI